MAKIPVHHNQEITQDFYFYQIKDAYVHGRITLAEIESKYELNAVAQAEIDAVTAYKAPRPADKQSTAADFVQ
jgi:hypothetical protein